MGTSEIEARLIKCIDEAMIRVEGITGAIRGIAVSVPRTPQEWYAHGVLLMEAVEDLKERVRFTRAIRNSICADMNERNRKEAADGKDAD